METIKFKEIKKNIYVYETFEPMSNNQTFDDVKIFLDIPISEIIFELENTKIALQFLAIKTLRPFNNPEDDYEFYINNEKINKDDLLLLEDDAYKFIDSFVEKHKKKLKKENNSIKIEFINPANFEYVKHIKIVNENEIEFHKLTED